jgi:hypothetical protein
MKKTFSSILLLATAIAWHSANAERESNFSLPPGFTALANPEPASTEASIQPPPNVAQQATTPTSTPVPPAVTTPPQPSTTTGKLTLKLVNSTKRYRIGEMVSFEAESSQACNLTVIDIGASGTVAVLFPNAYQQDNRLKAGRKLRIPDTSSPFQIKVSKPLGRERVIGICQTEQQSLFSEAYDFKRYVYRELPKNWESYINPTGESGQMRTELQFMVTE